MTVKRLNTRLLSRLVVTPTAKRTDEHLIVWVNDVFFFQSRSASNARFAKDVHSRYFCI